MKAPPPSKVYNPPFTRTSSCSENLKEKLEELNSEFQTLIEECAMEKHPAKKCDLRKSLAIIAKQMKMLR